MIKKPDYTSAAGPGHGSPDQSHILVQEASQY